jgi:adenylate kinase
VDQIEYHQQINRSFALTCAALAGAIYAPIHNQNKPIEAAQQLIELICSYKI